MPGLSKWLDISAASPNCILKDSKGFLKGINSQKQKEEKQEN